MRARHRQTRQVPAALADITSVARKPQAGAARRFFRGALPVSLLALAAACLVAAATAPTAGAAAWTEESGTKVFPSTKAKDRTTLQLYAAGDEYEAGQIVVRGTVTRNVSLTWASGSDSLLVDNSTLSRVGYVKTTRASTGTKAKVGYYPDPLIPKEFGQKVSAPASSTSFYVLVHVPRGAPAGDYTGTLNVTEGSTTTPITVALHVYAFDLPKERVPAIFSINHLNVKASLHGEIPWDSTNQRRVLGAYYDFYKEYGLSPGAMTPSAFVDPADGDLTNGDAWADRAAAWLDDDDQDAGFSVVRYGWNKYWPWRLSSPTSEKTKTIKYLTNLCRLFKERGWDDQGYAYPVDEPSPGKAEYNAQAYARMLHTASANAGYRAKYLLTTEPRPVTYKGRPPNKFLFDDVDIWATRVYRFWDWLGPLRARQKAGQEAWMYTYSFNAQAQKAPTFLIDEPLADEHAIFWMMWRWRADGTLYWRVNKWTAASGGSWRDPFKNPLSFKSRNGSLVFNGEASLLYPGYYPRYGFDDPYAPPMSSLRFEALRDGIEEHTYLDLAGKNGDYGELDGTVRDLADRLAEAMTYYPTGAYPWNWTNMPVFKNDANAYSGARRRIAEAIERAETGQAPNVATGVVLDEAGRPLPNATISDGVLTTTTDDEGRFTLDGVLASYRLSASHPRYRTSSQSGQAGASAHQFTLNPNGARILSSFSSKYRTSGTRLTRTVSSVRSTAGSTALKVSLRGKRAEFVYSLPSSKRNLRWARARRIELDVFSANGVSWKNPWKLKVVAYDNRGRRAWQRYILEPNDWTHVSLKLPTRNFNRGNVTKIVIKMTSSLTRTFWFDGLMAR